MAKVIMVKGTQHYYEYSFRGVDYKLTGRFGYHKGTVVAEGKGPNGEITWADEDGNFVVCPADDNWPASNGQVVRIWTQAI